MVYFCKNKTSKSCYCYFLKAKAWSEGVIIYLYFVTNPLK